MRRGSLKWVGVVVGVVVLVDTLLRNAPEIFAFHKTGRPSNGRIEGTNNKLGVLKRVAYGFVNVDNFAARGILTCPGTT